jgi:hypothetical protein
VQYFLYSFVRRIKLNGIGLPLYFIPPVILTPQICNIEVPDLVGFSECVKTHPFRYVAAVLRLCYFSEMPNDDEQDWYDEPPREKITHRHPTLPFVEITQERYRDAEPGDERLEHWQFLILGAEWQRRV